MNADYKPGDVAMVTAQWKRGIRDTAPAVLRPQGWERIEDGAIAYCGDTLDARPLVLIDPAVSQQVERLAALVRLHGGGHPYATLNSQKCREESNALADALRDFTRTPKITEPQGLGAVVENRRGYKYVRVADPIDGWAHGKQWQRIGGEINAVRNFGWGQIDAVRVLSEGVTA